MELVLSTYLGFMLNIPAVNIPAASTLRHGILRGVWHMDS